MAVNFFNEEINYNLPQKRAIKSWIANTCQNEYRILGEINIIFVSDDYLLDINEKYLNKSHLTDIITFNYNQNDVINGDIFISIPTVKDNSKNFKTSVSREVHRVIVHGILHLVGYEDHTDEERSIMRNKEDTYLDFFYSNMH